MANKSSTSR